MSLKKKRFQAIQEFRSTHNEAETPLLSEEKKKYDANATTDEILGDLRRVQEENPDTYITRKKYRKLGRFSDSTWDTKFGNFAEFRKQARLELSRGQQELERHIAKHASIDPVRGFSEVEILPWVGKYNRGDEPGRWKTVVVASDFHDAETDQFALEVFLDTVSRVAPDKIVLNGDVFDNYSFSRFDKDPRKCDIEGNMRFARENIFKALRDRSDAQIDLIVGNHETHLLRHMSNRTPELRVLLSSFMGLTLSDMFGLREFEINLICKSDLSAFRAADIRAEIAKNYATYWGCLTVNHYADDKFQFGTSWCSAHTHKPRLVTSCNAVLGGLWGMTTGCMANIDNSYTDGVNRNQNGFGIVHIDTHKKHTIPEMIVFSDSSAMVGGTRYSRP